MRSVKGKLYLFVILTVILVAASSILFSFVVNSKQINSYYMQLTTDNAKVFAAKLDGDYLKRLRAALETEEYQAIREKAEETENDELVKDYLLSKFSLTGNVTITILFLYLCIHINL